jgi:phage shock protein E
MRTILTLLAATCLVTGCSNRASNTDTTGSDTGRSQAESDSKSESAKTSPETSTSEQTVAASTDPKPLVIDVRTQAEWDESHLDIATHIPLDQITNRIVEVAPNKDQKVYLHCRSGGRSGQAKVELEGLGFTNVENVGGLEDARARFESGND